MNKVVICLTVLVMSLVTDAQSQDQLPKKGWLCDWFGLGKTCACAKSGNVYSPECNELCLKDEWVCPCSNGTCCPAEKSRRLCSNQCACEDAHELGIYYESERNNPNMLVTVYANASNLQRVLIFDDTLGKDPSADPVLRFSGSNMSSQEQDYTFPHGMNQVRANLYVSYQRGGIWHEPYCEDRAPDVDAKWHFVCDDGGGGGNDDISITVVVRS